MRAGESVIIEGMLRKSTGVKITKIPILGNLPLIGGFFSGKTTEEDNREIVFSIRPEILCETR